jgi:hypothetical protein
VSPVTGGEYRPPDVSSQSMLEARQPCAGLRVRWHRIHRWAGLPCARVSRAGTARLRSMAENCRASGRRAGQHSRRMGADVLLGQRNAAGGGLIHAYRPPSLPHRVQESIPSGIGALRGVPPVQLAHARARRYMPALGRSVAQPGRALCSGRRGRRFESSHSDQLFRQLGQA